jgi:hypothetical protein
MTVLAWIQWVVTAAGLVFALALIWFVISDWVDCQGLGSKNQEPVIWHTDEIGIIVNGSGSRSLCGVELEDIEPDDAPSLATCPECLRIENLIERAV